MAYTDIDDPSAYFQTVLWTGNGTAGNAVTFNGNSDMQPDFVWSKRRDSATHFVLKDTSTGGTSNNDQHLVSSLNQAENTYSQYRMDFDSNGFTLDGVGDSGFQGIGTSMVSWAWKANGGTTSSNTDGTGITSTVQANTDAGFSIVTYTGIGSGNANPSVGHGLGVTPQVVLVKGRSQANSWVMYHYGIDGANSRNKYLILNSSGAAGTLANYWGTAASGGVTSSTFGVYADNQSGNNYLNGTHVAYCFAEKQGYSKFGSYIGNGFANGPFVYTGFKPAFVMFKRSTGSQSWDIHDSTRDPFNPMPRRLLPNLAYEEETRPTSGVSIDCMDFLSNGFKIRSIETILNASGDTFVYMAFAENPFVTSTGIPTTAR
jgi:hypothetical protein